MLLLEVLTLADLVVSVSFGLYFPVGYFSGKTIFRIASDIMFLEGAVVFCVGALLAFLRSNISSISIIFMVTGGAMFGLSVVFGALG